jgi:hypothetical protein
MPDDDQPEPSRPSGILGEDPGAADAAGGQRSQTEPRKSKISSQITVVTATGIAIAVLLAVGVVISALTMKFEADQARWQQRQTCLEWYRLQAEYGLGPWYEKLPQAAEDCGGELTEDGDPLVPGGTGPALTEGDVPETTTTTPLTTTSTTTTVVPPAEFPSDDGTGGP